MKKDKLTAVIVFIIILFIVFVFGLFVGKKLSPKTSKEGTIKESSLKNKNKLREEKNNKEQIPVQGSNIKFTPLSKIAPLNSGNKSIGQKPASIKKAVNKPLVKPANKTAEKQKLKTKIVYIKKPVYVYKYIDKKSLSKKGAPFSANPKIYYTIQVAALSKYVQAKALADKLNSMGFFSYIVPVSVSGKNGKSTYQQIRVGKFSTINGAKSVENIISKKFKVKPYIIKVD